MRITKDPEERKQEILDTAIQVFYEKGYDKTSISDIAVKLGIAQGLCYRYFKSKEELFECALDYYAEQQVIQIKQVLCNESKSIQEILTDMPNFMALEKDNDLYYKLFHSENSRPIHIQLSFRICEKLLPAVVNLIQREIDKGRLKITDAETAANFCIYGQVGILLNEKLPHNEKIPKIKDFLYQFIQ